MKRLSVERYVKLLVRLKRSNDKEFPWEVSHHYGGDFVYVEGKFRDRAHAILFLNVLRAGHAQHYSETSDEYLEFLEKRERK